MARTVPHIGRSDVAGISGPGRYQFKFGWVTITVDDLAVWSQHPGATFAVYEIDGETPGEFRLGVVNLYPKVVDQMRQL